MVRKTRISETTIRHNINRLKQLFSWFKSENKVSLEELTNDLIKKYIMYLSKRLSSSSIKSHQTIIRQLDKYYQKMHNKKLLTEELEKVKLQTEEKEILTESEIKKLYNNTEDSILGYRDKAIIALYYGCGLRRQEGIKLKEKDINHTKKVIYIKTSKTHKSRYVPMSEGVQRIILQYQKYSRPYITKIKTHHLLISQKTGKGLTSNSVYKRIQLLSEKANLGKPTTIHQLRHSIATHLLQKGMNLEQIAQFLGHKSLDSTQIYTHIVLKKPLLNGC